jgi:hypothetical protein
VTCSRCHDHGYYGGKLVGAYAGPWRWCDCPASYEKRDREPDLVDLANAARSKLLALDKKSQLPGIQQFASAIDGGGDDYKGEF